MQERVGILKGDFQIESLPGNGCCITVAIPMYISNNFSNLDNLDNLDNFKSIEQKDDLLKIDISKNEN